MNFENMNVNPTTSMVNYPVDIAAALIDLIGRAEEVGYNGIQDPDVIERYLIDGLYYLRACAENDYNSDYFRVLYSALSKLCEIKIYREV